jgi:hypothetical protein
MKFKLFAIVISLSLVAWAQENPSNSTPNPAPEAKSCCHHAMDAKDAAGCCHHADAKDTASCCGSGCCGRDKCDMKDAKSCCSGKDMQASMKQCKKNGGCADGKCCGNGKGDKSATNCCGSKCEHHEHAASVS